MLRQNKKYTKSAQKNKFGLASHYRKAFVLMCITSRFWRPQILRRKHPQDEWKKNCIKTQKQNDNLCLFRLFSQWLYKNICTGHLFLSLDCNERLRHPFYLFLPSIACKYIWFISQHLNRVLVVLLLLLTLLWSFHLIKLMIFFTRHKNVALVIFFAKIE